MTDSLVLTSKIGQIGARQTGKIRLDRLVLTTMCQTGALSLRAVLASSGQDELGHRPSLAVPGRGGRCLIKFGS